MYKSAQRKPLFIACLTCTITSVSLTVLLSGEGDASRRPGASAVAGHHRTGVGGVWREAGHCEWTWLGGGQGEGGGRGGGGAGEGVAGDDSITQSHRWRGPGEVHLSLSSSSHKHLWSTSWLYTCSGQKQSIYKVHVLVM